MVALWIPCGMACSCAGAWRADAEVDVRRDLIAISPLSQAHQHDSPGQRGEDQRPGHAFQGNGACARAGAAPHPPRPLLVLALIAFIAAPAPPVPPLPSPPSHQENISNFLKACRGLGMFEFEMFSTQDLFDEKDINQVRAVFRASPRLGCVCA